MNISMNATDEAQGERYKPNNANKFEKTSNTIQRNNKQYDRTTNNRKKRSSQHNNITYQQQLPSRPLTINGTIYIGQHVRQSFFGLSPFEKDARGTS